MKIETAQRIDRKFDTLIALLKILYLEQNPRLSYSQAFGPAIGPAIETAVIR